MIAVGEAREQVLIPKLPGVSGQSLSHRGREEAAGMTLKSLSTPLKITARWNGQVFSVTPAKLQHQIDDALTKYPMLNGRMPREFIPKMELSGGIGLYVQRGSASFRSFTVTPLKTSLISQDLFKELDCNGSRDHLAKGPRFQSRFPGRSWRSGWPMSRWSGLSENAG